MLETAEITFRGEFRLVIPFSSIDAIEATNGDLLVRANGEESVFALGARAVKWRDAILNPKSRLDKLGVKPGMTVALVGRGEAGFADELSRRGAVVEDEDADEPLDLLFYAIDDIAALDRLEDLRGRIRPDGAIWVVTAKGKGAPVKDTDVIAAAKAQGLVDTKVVSFSDRHTGQKLVIPLASRPKAKAPGVTA